MSRSRGVWIAATAALALLGAMVATCEPAAEVRKPRDSADPGSVESSPGKRVRARARRDGTTAETPAAEGPGTPAEAAVAAPPPSEATESRLLVQLVSGTVLDSADDTPVVGARVILALFDPGGSVPGASWGSVSSASGSFDVGPTPAERQAASRAEVLVSAPGYHVGRAPAEPGVVVRLERRRRPEPPGVLVGTVLDASGRPVPGVRQLSCRDVIGDWQGFWTLVAEDGSFRVPGVAAGPWRIGAAEGQPSVECLVPGGGEVRVTLTVAADERPHAKKTDAELQERIRFVPVEIKGCRFIAGTEEGRAEIARLQLELQDLRWEELVRRPVRRVAVEGLPADARILRVRRPGTSQTWTADVAGGRAEFAALYVTAWDLEVERPGADVAVRHVEVPEGAEPLVVRWTEP